MKPAARMGIDVGGTRITSAVTTNRGAVVELASSTPDRVVDSIGTAAAEHTASGIELTSVERSTAKAPTQAALGVWHEALACVRSPALGDRAGSLGAGALAPGLVPG